MGTFTQFNEMPLAQTFTVGVSGLLDRVEVRANPTQKIGDLLVEIQNTDAQGKPILTGPSVLAAASVPLTDLPDQGFGAIDFSQSNFTMHEGDVLALVMRRDRGGDGSQFGVAWYGGLTAKNQDYPGGAAWGVFGQSDWIRSANGRTSDYGFRTYVTPLPDPAGGALFLAACGWLLRRRQAAGLA